MERVARFAASTESSTALRFEQLQQERLKRRTEIEAWERVNGNLPLMPACQDMCPEYERLERELHLDVHPFEAKPGKSFPQNTPTIDHGRAVKKYHRPAAGNETPLPEDIRTPEALQQTLKYLFHEILDNKQLASFHEIHSFIRDRTRSIRQDLTLQSCRDARAVLMHEQIARFHILSGHVLCEADPAEFDSFQNTEQLRKVLQSLHEMYEDLATTTTFPNEDEFRAYYVLTHIQDPTVFRSAMEFPDNVQLSANVQFALRAAACFHQGNYVGYCRMIRMGDYLQASLLHSHLTAVRFKALTTMSEAYNQGEVQVSLICDLLLFVNEAEAADFLFAHGLLTLGGVVKLNPPQPPTEPVRPKQLKLVEHKRLAPRLSEVVMNRPEQSNTTPPGSTIEWRREMSNDIYKALVEFCVPILMGSVVMNGFNESKCTISHHWHAFKQQLKEQLYQLFMDWALHELCSELIHNVIIEQQQSVHSEIVRGFAGIIYENILCSLVQDWLKVLVDECRPVQFYHLNLKKLFLKTWRTQTKKQLTKMKHLSNHQCRVKEEHFAASKLLTEVSIQHGPTRVIDLDSLFTFPDAVVWLTFDPESCNVKIVSLNAKVISDLNCSPHLVICLSHQRSQVQNAIVTLQVPWTVHCLNVDDVGCQVQFDNQIPELLKISKDSLALRLGSIIDQCVCVEEYRNRLILFIHDSIDFLVYKDPAKRLHPHCTEEAVFLPSLKQIEEALKNMTRGLGNAINPPTPIKRHKSSQKTSTNTSPLKKLQKVLAEERRSSANFERVLVDALKQHQQ